jgi:hypothetical protein
VTKYFLEKGASTNRKTKSGETPLHLAAMFGQAVMVRYEGVRGRERRGGRERREREEENGRY